MTAKEKIMNALKGAPVSKLPWSPNLPFWWEAQSDRFIRTGEIPYLQSIGADPMIRGRLPYNSREWVDLYMYDIHYNHCERSTYEKNGIRYDIYKTSLGELEAAYKYSP